MGPNNTLFEWFWVIPINFLTFLKVFFTDLKVFKEIFKKSQGFAPTKLGRSGKRKFCLRKEGFALDTFV